MKKESPSESFDLSIDEHFDIFLVEWPFFGIIFGQSLSQTASHPTVIGFFFFGGGKFDFVWGQKNNRFLWGANFF